MVRVLLRVCVLAFFISIHVSGLSAQPSQDALEAGTNWKRDGDWGAAEASYKLAAEFAQKEKHFNNLAIAYLGNL